MRRAYFRAWWRSTGAACCLAALLVPSPADAGPEPQYGWRETWVGADASSRTWLMFSGVSIAPFGHVYSEGLRLRASGGYGQYSYKGTREDKVIVFDATTSYAEALVGYLKTFGPLTAKAFAGVAVIEHDIVPFDPDNPLQGQKVGPKLVGEFWLNMGPFAWSSVDLSWTSAYSTSAAHARTGYRIFDDVSLGIEGAINANTMGEDARAGLFVRYAWEGGEVSLAGGFSGRFLDEAEAIRDPYATLNWLTQF